MSSERVGLSLKHQPLLDTDMNNKEFAAALPALFLFLAAAINAAATPNAPFSAQDMVALHRLADIEVSPDGKRVLYSLRSTDMSANKGHRSMVTGSGQARRQTGATDR